MTSSHDEEMARLHQVIAGLKRQNAFLRGMLHGRRYRTGVVERPAGRSTWTGASVRSDDLSDDGGDLCAGRERGRCPPIAFVRQGAPRTLLMHGLRTRRCSSTTRASWPARCRRPAGRAQDRVRGHRAQGLVLAISRPLRWRAPVLKEMVAFVAHGGQMTARGHRLLGQLHQLEADVVGRAEERERTPLGASSGPSWSLAPSFSRRAISASMSSTSMAKCSRPKWADGIAGASVSPVRALEKTTTRPPSRRRSG